MSSGVGFARDGATHNLNCILFYIYDSLRKFYIVLFSTVISDASLGCY